MVLVATNGSIWKGGYQVAQLPYYQQTNGNEMRVYIFKSSVHCFTRLFLIVWVLRKCIPCIINFQQSTRRFWVNSTTFLPIRICYYFNSLLLLFFRFSLQILTVTPSCHTHSFQGSGQDTCDLLPWRGITIYPWELNCMAVLHHKWQLNLQSTGADFMSQAAPGVPGLVHVVYISKCQLRAVISMKL